MKGHGGLVAITIGSNIQSLVAQRYLDRSMSQLSASSERLASGLRINRAADDAAGLAISSNLSLENRVYGQAVRNLNDGLTVFNIAEGALESLTDITIRQKELAEQAANGTYSLAQRQKINQEANALVDEFNRIVASVDFNDLKLLDGSQIGGMRLQAGFSVEGSLVIGIGNELARTVGDGNFGASTAFDTGGGPREITLGDFNRDGILDIATPDVAENAVTILIGNGDGSFKARVSFSTGDQPDAMLTGDYNSDGKLDLITANYNATSVSVLLGNGNGSFSAAVSYSGVVNPSSLAQGDFNRDGSLDLVVGTFTGTSIGILYGNANGSFKAMTSITGLSQPSGVRVGDFNGDGYSDISSVDRGSNQVSVFLGTGTTSFGSRIALTAASQVDSLTTGDFNSDGLSDIAVIEQGASDRLRIFLSQGNGSFATGVSYVAGNDPAGITTGDFDGNGILDIATANVSELTMNIFLGNGDGTFLNRRSTASGGGSLLRIAVGDLNGDGVTDAVVADVNNTADVRLGTARRVTSIARLDLLTAESARNALTTISATLDRLSSEKGAIGAIQSRAQVALANLSTTRENYSAAHSRITDVDVAQESSEFVRATTLQQTAAAILAQANQRPAMVLQLLR